MDKDGQVSAFYRVLITIVWVFSIIIFRYRFREDVMYKAKVKNRKLRRTFGDIKEDFGKQVGEINLLVATLITTVTFAAAFTVPGGYKSEGVDEGLAILCKRFSFGVFLIANTLAFGLSTTSVFIHFFATTTITSADFHREVAQHTPLFTKWSIGALLSYSIAKPKLVWDGLIG
ncbi:hypothetical protein CFP56_012064 [Quercus suber]|uniref:PGG domain-containing protein n=1 Tax=Quercus suber TaxID=58331 RepID=A0AAW0KWC9_QUESU